MKYRKNILLIAAAVLVVIPLALFLREPAPLDLSKDEEPFRSMVLPPKSVQAGYYMDGGTVKVRVTDQRGAIHSVTFPFAMTVSSHLTKPLSMEISGKRPL